MFVLVCLVIITLYKELPKSFNEHLQDPLPQTAKLQGIGGGVWSVSFKKIGDYEYFTSGWSKFAEDHKLKDGEFLTFVYDGSHTFEVSVFGLSGCKEIGAVVETVNLSDANSDEEEDDDVIIINPPKIPPHFTISFIASAASSPPLLMTFVGSL